MLSNTYASQLLQVRDSLTAETWHKGHYFAVKDNTVCHCVHGAAQRLVNPAVQKAFEQCNIQLPLQSIINNAGALVPSDVYYAATDAAMHALLTAACGASPALASTNAEDLIKSSAVSGAEFVAKHGEANVKHIGLIKDLCKAWKSRADYFKKDHFYGGVNYGTRNLHYLMGMFGITAAFNDAKTTTLEMLKDKLTKAAEWAEANEEFLANN